MPKTQLLELTKPFSKGLVKQKPNSSKADYVPHAIVTERLLHVVGNYDMRVVEVIRGDTAARKGSNRDYPALVGAVVGAIVQLTVEVDGKRVTVEEVGSCENPHLKGNDGDRLKDAISDAFKRCAMRLGLGLHLWSREQSFLHKSLLRDSRESQEASEGEEVGTNLPPLPDEPEIEPGSEEETEVEDDDGAEVAETTYLNEGEFSTLLDILDDSGLEDDYHAQFIETNAGVKWSGEVLPRLSHEQAAAVARAADRYKAQHGNDEGKYPPEPEQPIYRDDEPPQPIETTPAMPTKKSKATTEPPMKQSRSKKNSEGEFLNTQGQQSMHMQLSNYGMEKSEHYAFVSQVVKRQITSFSEVRTDEQGPIYTAARNWKKR